MAGVEGTHPDVAHAMHTAHHGHGNGSVQHGMSTATHGRGPSVLGSAADVREDARDHGADEYRERA